MTSTINSCSYDPNGGKKFEPIDPLKPLQTGGKLDISSDIKGLVDHFYKGNSKYTLTLRNNKMVLELWDNDSGTRKHKHAKIKLKDGEWNRTDYSNPTEAKLLNNTDEITDQLFSTLRKIQEAYTKANPGIGSGAAPAAAVGAMPHCDHSASFDRLHDMLNLRLSELSRNLEALAKLPSRIDQSLDALQNLEKTAQELQNTIASLQADIRRLNEQNNDLKGLREPLDRLARDVPTELHEIRNSIQQLGINLGRIQRESSEGAQALERVEMQQEIGRMREQLRSLANTFQPLQEKNKELLRENAALKLQDADQKRKLSLQDRQILELSQANHAQENKLEKLQAEHGQLRTLFTNASEENQQVQKDLSGKLQELQQASAQALVVKEDRIQALQGQLAASQKQNEEIGKLRANLEENNAQLAQAKQENAEHQQTIAQARATDKIAQQDLAQLNVKLVEKEDQRQTLMARVSQQGTTIANLRGQSEEQKQQIARLEEQAQKTQQMLKTKEAEAAKTQLALASAQQSLESLKTSMQKDREYFDTEQSLNTQMLEKYSDDAVKLRSQLSAAQAETKNVTTKAEQEKQDLLRKQAEMVAAYENNQIKMKDAAKSSDEELETLRSLDTCQTEEIEDLQAQLSTLQKEAIAALEGQLSTLNVQLETASKTNAASLDKIQELGATLTEKEKDATAAKETAAKATTAVEELRKKSISDDLLQKELSETLRLLQAAEKARLGAENKNALLEKNNRTLTKQIEAIKEEIRVLDSSQPSSQSSSPAISPVKNTSSDESSDMSQINITLKNIQGAISTLDEVNPLWVGPIVINMAFLDGKLANDKQTWIQGKFGDAIEHQELTRLEKSLTAHYEPPLARRTYSETNVRKVAGDLNTALADPAIKALKDPNRFITLDSCFGESLFIVRKLQEAKMKLQPIVAQYQKLSDKDAHRQEKFARAQHLIGQIDLVLQAIGQKLNHQKWNIKK